MKQLAQNHTRFVCSSAGNWTSFLMFRAGYQSYPHCVWYLFHSSCSLCALSKGCILLQPSCVCLELDMVHLHVLSKCSDWPEGADLGAKGCGNGRSQLGEEGENSNVFWKSNFCGCCHLVWISLTFLNIQVASRINTSPFHWYSVDTGLPNSWIVPNIILAQRQKYLSALPQLQFEHWPFQLELPTMCLPVGL